MSHVASDGFRREMGLPAPPSDAQAALDTRSLGILFPSGGGKGMPDCSSVPPTLEF